jgi:PAS domain S-box-containing protein
VGFCRLALQITEMNGRVTLLLVDDDAGFLEVAATELEREGPFAVETATGAAEALSAVDDDVDCVVSDHDMDEATGLDLFARLRERGRSVPFVLYTATESADLAERALDAGVTDFVRKRGEPTEFVVLANRLRRIVDRRTECRNLERVLDTVADPVFVVDDDLDLVRWNDAFARRHDREVSVGDHADLVDVDAAAAALRRTLRAGERVTHEVTAAEADGDRAYELRLSPVDLPAGRHAVAVARDVTDRREARRRVEENERRLAELAGSTDDVFWIFEAGFSDLLFVNDAYESVYGGSIDDLDDDPRAFLETIHPEDRDLARDRMAAVSRGESVDVEYRVNPPAYDRWVWVEAEPIVEDGEVVRVAGFSRDVTDRKARAREMEAQNERLERLASIVSHDLQSPLSVVEGSIDLARETGDDSHLDRAERAAVRIGELAEDILTLARRGDAVGDLEPVTLSAVAQRAWDETDTTGARLVVESDGRVEADPQRLRQLFANLFDNAATHGVTGADDEVVVRFGTVHDGFYVADDGPGVSDDVGEAVFDPTYTTASDGTGLGLDIVRSIAEAHGWSVGLEESVDGGARFAVTAPVRTTAGAS